MKLFVVVALSAGVAMGSAWAGSQDTGAPSNLPPYGVYGLAPGVTYPWSPEVKHMKRVRLIALRHEALALREKDGGTLTPEHYAILQAKLDRINAAK